jgi:tRNA(fMet)-specific endonuclease VapC
VAYLLDTDILSALLRAPTGAVATHIAQKGLSNVRTSIIVASELRFGAQKRGSDKLTEEIEGLLARMPVAPFESPADKIYGRIRCDLERFGTPIRANDLFIAAHAVALGDTLVTNNTREFSRVSALTTENWLA